MDSSLLEFVSSGELDSLALQARQRVQLRPAALGNPYTTLTPTASRSRIELSSDLNVYIAKEASCWDGTKARHSEGDHSRQFVNVRGQSTTRDSKR